MKLNFVTKIVVMYTIESIYIFLRFKARLLFEIWQGKSENSNKDQINMESNNNQALCTYLLM